MRNLVFGSKVQVTEKTAVDGCMRLAGGNATPKNVVRDDRLGRRLEWAVVTGEGTAATVLLTAELVGRQPMLDAQVPVELHVEPEAARAQMTHSRR